MFQNTLGPHARGEAFSPNYIIRTLLGSQALSVRYLFWLRGQHHTPNKCIAFEERGTMIKKPSPIQSRRACLAGKENAMTEEDPATTTIASRGETGIRPAPGRRHIQQREAGKGRDEIQHGRLHWIAIRQPN